MRAACILLCVALSGCGLKGDLFIPEDSNTPASGTGTTTSETSDLSGATTEAGVEPDEPDEGIDSKAEASDAVSDEAEPQ